jgi:hypothetical protein
MTTSYSSFTSTHLPEFESLDRLNNQWFIFGTLTYRHTPPLPATQLKDFVQLMDRLGQLNFCHPDLLQWFVRVEYSFGARWHLHFLLGEDRIANGYTKPMSVDDGCRFLKKNWSHGDADIRPYDLSEDGVGYLTKTLQPDQIGDTLMSKKLKRVLKNLPHSCWREDLFNLRERCARENRDEFGVELITRLRRRGTDACFMDEARKVA